MKNTTRGTDAALGCRGSGCATCRAHQCDGHWALRYTKTTKSGPKASNQTVRWSTAADFRQRIALSSVISLFHKPPLHHHADQQRPCLYRGLLEPLSNQEAAMTPKMVLAHSLDSEAASP
ncbi:hypothetical protein ACTXJX_19035 [Glutamicibacter ardleyensis]|uniref:hypothetical protein n=1 Tax=Glutamicibacter ardleyensis TaxID=225894 RepID=UPI003FD18FC1